MLTLKRYPRATPADEAVVVLILPDASEVRVHLIRQRDGHVRVGIDARRDVQVERGEVYRRLRGADPTGPIPLPARPTGGAA